MRKEYFLFPIWHESRIILQDPKKLERCAKEAEKIEHLADGVTHEVAAKMKHVFITPIDREDFYLLTSNLDDCVDDIKDVIFTLRIYHAGLGWNRMLRMADILIEMSGELIILFRLLKDIDKNETGITERARKINRGNDGGNGRSGGTRR